MSWGGVGGMTRGLRVLALVGLCAFAGPGWATPSGEDPLAPDPRRVRLVYGIHAGGMKVMEATIAIDAGIRDYAVEATAATQGILNWIVSWQTLTRSEGALDGSRIIPERHRALSTWRGDERQVAITYDQDGDLVVDARPDAEADDREPVPPEMRIGTFDPLSAVFGVLTAVAEGDACTAEMPVFDGRRRYDLRFRDRGTAIISSNQYSVYAGPAMLCTVDFDLLAGGMRSSSRGADDREREPARLFLATPPGMVLPVPVRLESDSRFGSVFVHLQSVGIGE